MNITSSPVVLLKCRICLADSQEETMSSLFDDEAENNDLLNEKVEFCCGIKVRRSAQMPTKVCSSCSEFVRMWFNFRQMCLNSQVYWETSCPDSERPDDLVQVSDGEYMEYLYENLQLNLSPGNNCQEEISQVAEEEQQLEDQVQEDLDINGFIINDQIEEDDEQIKESSEQMLISHLDAYANDPEVAETIEDKGELVEDSSLLNEEYYEVDYEELNEDDFLSTSPSPAPSPQEDTLNSGRFRKLGRPRKPDSELKFKRKDINGKGKASKTKTEDKFVCNLCGNVYYKKSIFTAHLMTHTEYKPHQCEICNKSFRQMGELRAHIRRHTGVRPYKCMYCDRHFYDRSERVRHERVHTNTRPYACQECGKTFTHTAILKNHLLVHSGEKNYNCDICSKSFTLLHQLKAHLQTLTHRNKLESTIPNSTDFSQS
ncbi:zinc finger protein 771 [Drosophila rhopaloa]|uniref:Zinc finger protein 771 n=1 Tax=Drosophila rhopaloa TaxID=1041015 RepID=A0A6P4EUG5_DRORH|nr:zinc finger protein 771 [Drosophila rhopaloa]